MTQYQRELEGLASQIPTYSRDKRSAKQITEWVDQFIAAREAGDEALMQQLDACLMLKHQNDVVKMADKVKTTGLYTVEDCQSEVWRCIHVGINQWAAMPAEKKAKTNAMAVIATCIACRGAAQIMVESNSDGNKAFATAVSMDQPMSKGSDEADSLLDVVAGSVDEAAETMQNLNARRLVQRCIDKQKLIEAIVLDTIQFDECYKETKKQSSYVNEEGEEIKYASYSREHSDRFTVRALTNLPEGYGDYFEGTYDVDHAAFEATLERIRSVDSSKLYKFVEGAKNFARIDYMSSRS